MFITAHIIIKLRAGVGRDSELRKDICYEVRRAEARAQACHGHDVQVDRDEWANLPPSLSDFGPWSQFFPDDSLDLESGVSSWASGGPQELSAGCAPPKTEVIAPRYSYNAGKTGLDGVATRRAVGEGFL